MAQSIAEVQFRREAFIGSPGSAEETRDVGKTFLWGGIVWALVGLVALIVPVISSVALNIVFGALLIVGGASKIYFAMQMPKKKTGAVLLGLLSVIAGILMVVNPFAGAIALSVLFAVVLLVDGLISLSFAVAARPLPQWGWLAFSGVLAIMLAALILVGLPASGIRVPGILLGVSLLFSGVSLALLGHGMRSLASSE